MKIEAGKYYLRADGRKAGPAEPTGSDTYPFNVPYGNGHLFHGYTSEGVSCINSHNALLIAEWHDTETGTLKELNVKPGDVVECVRSGSRARIFKSDNGKTVFTFGHGGEAPIDQAVERYRIISRASDTPKTWGEMTDAEKGALLLAAHEGDVIESYTDKMWMTCAPKWRDDYAYRVRSEPKRWTVDLMADFKRIGTIDLVDGQPDPASIKMEDL